MHSLFGVRIDDLPAHQLQKRLVGWFQDPKLHAIFTPNPEFLLTARKEKSFAKLLNQSDLSLADGIGLKFAIAALTDNRLAHRHTGIDTFLLLARLCTEQKKRLLLLGGINKAAVHASKTLRQKWPELDVVFLELGFIPGGFISLSIPKTLITEIQTIKPDVMAIALGQGKQERFILELKNQIPSLRIAIGVGGTFDTISGRLKRAPQWMRHYGFEWMWRVLIEPRRVHRILRAAVSFPIAVIWDTVKHRRFWKAFRMVMIELKKHFF
jgi:N-acetylglucosaminyldiphosphoundecaprenol N-acetyl-beta-D-mannosaminyltransferase